MGVVVQKHKKTLAEDAALELSVLPGETQLYRLILPVNQLEPLSKLAPDLEVIEIQAFGSMSTMNVKRDFELGHVAMGTSGNLAIDWVYDSQRPSIKLAKVYQACLNEGFADVSVSRLVYLKKLTAKAQASMDYDKVEIPQHIRLIFQSEAVHPQAYRKVIIDGESKPMSEMYGILKRFQAKLDVTKKQKATIRPNYLRLLGIYPKTANILMTDLGAIHSFREPGMFIAEETSKPANVKDMKLE